PRDRVIGTCPIRRAYSPGSMWRDSWGWRPRLSWMRAFGAPPRVSDTRHSWFVAGLSNSERAHILRLPAPIAMPSSPLGPDFGDVVQDDRFRNSQLGAQS